MHVGQRLTKKETVLRVRAQMPYGISTLSANVFLGQDIETSHRSDAGFLPRSAEAIRSSLWLDHVRGHV